MPKQPPPEGPEAPAPTPEPTPPPPPSTGDPRLDEAREKLRDLEQYDQDTWQPPKRGRACQ